MLVRMMFALALARLEAKHLLSMCLLEAEQKTTQLVLSFPFPNNLKENRE
jgi:hypothetical protein